MMKIGLTVPENHNACYGQTMYNLVHLPDGKCRVDWWTDDNLDEGCASMEATAHYACETEKRAIECIVCCSPYDKPLDHSWYGLYDNPVFVHIDGKLLPFTQPFRPTLLS